MNGIRLKHVAVLAVVVALFASFACATSAQAQVDWGAGQRAITDKYNSGNFRSILGAPLDQIWSTPERTGLFQEYDHGSIYWTPWTGAKAVYGAIYAEWASRGWEGGHFGFPTSDEFADGGCSFMGFGARGSNFEGGTICWSPSNGVRAFPQPTVRIHSLTFGRSPIAGLPTRMAGSVTAYISDGQISYITCTNVTRGGSSTTIGPVERTFGKRSWSIGLLMLAGDQVRCAISTFGSDSYANDNTLTLPAR